MGWFSDITEDRKKEPSTAPVMPTDSLEDQLKDLGLSPSQLAGVLEILDGERAQEGFGTAAQVVHDLKVSLGRTYFGSCLSVALFGEHSFSHSEIARRFGVSRQGVRQRSIRLSKLIFGRDNAGVVKPPKVYE